jgi:hypothetical protein
MLSRDRALDKDSAATRAALAWARSGAMALTGPRDGEPSLAPCAVAAAMERAASALASAAARRGASLALDGPALLGERAALAGLRRRGRTSAGGASRLLRAQDGWLAVTLARRDDVASLPAWLEGPVALAAGDPWPALEMELEGRRSGELVARAGLLGLPVARADEPPAAPPAPVGVVTRGPARERSGRAAPFVVDLSALWAGPLCAELLAASGACVVKVESRTRPDGARSGSAPFFDLLNAGKRSALVDLACEADRAALRRLIARADAVVESARPRALRQLGIDAEELVSATPGLVWVSITGHGRGSDRVAFGDDAAAAGGLAALAGRGGEGPIFCADAAADPLAGLHAAVAVLEAWERGDAVLLDVALARVAAHAAGGPAPPRARVRGSRGGFVLEVDGERTPVAPPRARRASRRARALGADTRAVLA